MVIDVVGYLGMGFILFSFLMKKIKWIRFINLIGGILSCVYGFYTHTYPTAILNLSLICINLIYLIIIIINERKEKIKK